MIMRRYAMELGAGLLFYGAVLPLIIFALRNGWVGEDWKVPLLLLPMLPVFVIAWVILRQIRRLDEFQRKTQLEVLAFSFAGTALLSLSYGFLEIAGLPKLSMFYVWPVMSALWIIGGLVSRLHYR
ncbi:MAG: hypothetical protein ACOVN0_00585 [Niveispirillum sp.]|uniref:hypothetical protein n=1 Tax=Niveispirillum sp. TaxID=1917217 RepID=UPI003BA7E4D7